MLLSCLNDWAHPHFLLRFVLHLKISYFPAHFYLWLEILLLFFNVNLKILLGLSQKFSSFFSYLIQRLRFVLNATQINWFFILLLFHLFFGLLLISKLLHFFRVFDKVLWEFANYLQSFFRSDGKVIEYF